MIPNKTEESPFMLKSLLIIDQWEQDIKINRHMMDECLTIIDQVSF
jgi:hypothetical protein